MTTHALAAAIAQRMKNGAEARRYRVFESSFAGGSEVFASEDAKAVRGWLKRHGALGATAVMDGGYYLVTPGGESLFQGSAKLDNWIESVGN